MAIDYDALAEKLKKTAASAPADFNEDFPNEGPAKECYHRDMKPKFKYCPGCGLPNTPEARRKDTARFWGEKMVNDDHGDFDDVHDYGLD